MYTRWKSYCNVPRIKSPSTCHTWKDQNFLRRLLSHGAEGYCSVPSLFFSYLSHLVSPSSNFCLQLLKSQILSIFLCTASYSCHLCPEKCTFLNIPTPKERHKYSKHAATNKEKEVRRKTGPLDRGQDYG